MTFSKLVVNQVITSKVLRSPPWFS